MTDNTTEIPLFPLRTIVFPGGVLPLRIFEPRYTDMISNSIKQNSGFGVCGVADEPSDGTIDEPDGGEDSAIYKVGTTVKVIDFESLPEGLLGITVLGEKKYQLIDSYVLDDQLRIGRVNYLEPEAELALPQQFCRLAELLRRMFPDVEKYYGEAHMQSIVPNYESAEWVGARLTEYLPLDLAIKQTLLECQDPLERLQNLYEALKRNQ